MKKYRIIHIPTGLFSEITEEDIRNGKVKWPKYIKKDTILLHVLMLLSCELCSFEDCPVEDCESDNCPWYYEGQPNGVINELEYIIEEIP